MSQNDTLLIFLFGINGVIIHEATQTIKATRLKEIIQKNVDTKLKIYFFLYKNNITNKQNIWAKLVSVVEEVESLQLIDNILAKLKFIS